MKKDPHVLFLHSLFPNLDISQRNQDSFPEFVKQIERGNRSPSEYFFTCWNLFVQFLLEDPTLAIQSFFPHRYSFDSSGEYEGWHKEKVSKILQFLKSASSWEDISIPLSLLLKMDLFFSTSHALTFDSALFPEDPPLDSRHFQIVIFSILTFYQTLATSNYPHTLGFSRDDEIFNRFLIFGLKVLSQKPIFADDFIYVTSYLSNQTSEFFCWCCDTPDTDPHQSYFQHTIYPLIAHVVFSFVSPSGDFTLHTKNFTLFVDLFVEFSIYFHLLSSSFFPLLLNLAFLSSDYLLHDGTD